MASQSMAEGAGVHKGGGQAQAGRLEATQKVDTPKGTLMVLLIYAGVLIGLWGYMYITMLLRR